MKRILIVEDETFVRFLYRESLSEKYLIDEAEDGFEAIERLGENKYNLILLDLNIPIYNGLEVLRKIRDKGIETKVIVVSAYGMAEKKEEAFKYGAVDYLIKPVDLTELKSKVAKWCE